MIKKKSISFRFSKPLVKRRNERNRGRNPASLARLKSLNGIVKRHSDGFGFFISTELEHPDVYMPRQQMTGLMNGDKIKIVAIPRRNRKDLFSGKVLQLIERSHKKITGPYFPISNSKGLIKDDNQWGEDVKIQLSREQKIKKGEWVEIQVTSWPSDERGFCGKVIASLGNFPEALEDNIRIIRKNNILVSFNPQSVREAEKSAKNIRPQVTKKRRDLRSLPFVTIDGETAKDFDDAIYVTSLKKSAWRVYVAIADVSSYVPIGSVLDKEACSRGNSTYFPDFVVPMLPPILSDDLCSLKPMEDRLVFVAQMDFDEKAKMEKAIFYEGIIKSQSRLNYGQAQEMIDDSNLQQTSNLVFKNVLEASTLAKKLLEARKRKTFINLEIPETEVKLNRMGHPVDIIQEKRLFSHQVIEELMLVANQAVAEFFQKKKSLGIYRVHDKPKKENLQLLQSFVHTLGMKVNLVEPNLQKKISSMVQRFSKHRLIAILHILILRSLSQAIYSNKSQKHFGLNFTYYTHFTSPIRRYSDLVVHRILKALLQNQAPPYKISELATLAQMTSACEQKSVKAERQIADIKKARFIKKYIGEEMEGMISSVTSFGFFIKLRLFDIEGLVRIESLPKSWIFEPALLQLKSKHSGQRLRIGDPVVVQIISAEIDTGQVNFQLKTHKKNVS